MTRRKLNVFIIDDSALMRQLLSNILGRDPQLHVIGSAADPVTAWRKMKDLPEIDVVTLDVEMPRMDGLTFLDKIMTARPMPIVMVSSLTEQGCATTLRALELGAVDFVTKPKLDLQAGTNELGDEIVQKVKAAASARVGRRRATSGAVKTTVSAPVAWSGAAFAEATHRVLCFGASTGGTEALRAVLTAFPADAPGIVIAQHMPQQFTKSFAERLNSLCRIRVKEAEDGDRVIPGVALLAPGNFHMRVVRSGAEYRVRLAQDPPVNRHRPSVDALFESCAHALGPDAIGVILADMGDDGARGLRQMRQAGARTIAQDEQTCVGRGDPAPGCRGWGGPSTGSGSGEPPLMSRNGQADTSHQSVLPPHCIR
ncbi:MAG: chemotaxis response regulator protein-glutamate methylesterase [Cytophagaceae bacterium]|nr:chemotaxis response regulator protein-glutamate methylesterase [Gemmatimonadaceae bacterium]